MTEDEWRTQLSEEQFYVARHNGTERPSSSGIGALFEPGRYHCICCGTALFDSTRKFDSGSGWPSFTGPVTLAVLAYHLDTSHGTQRIEATCNVCDAHLGHVSPDGPPASGLCFCINTVSLRKAVENE